MDSATPHHLVRRIFDLFVDIDRLRVAARLAERAWTVPELATELGLKPRAVHNHLSRLEGAGLLITDDGAGGQRCHRLDVQALRTLNQRVRESDEHEPPPELREAGDREQKILADFFDGQRLKAVPAQRDKRIVVLAWLATRFSADVEYPEREVNEILKQHHPDFALLRRELVDEGFLSRDHGVYWLRAGEQPA